MGRHDISSEVCAGAWPARADVFIGSLGLAELPWAVRTAGDPPNRPVMRTETQATVACR